MTMDSQDKHPYKNHRFSQAFGHAMAGFWAALKSERNLRFHCTAGIVVVLAGFFFHLTSNQWSWILLAIALVIAAELSNTAIEEAVDAAVGHHYDPHAKKAKDVAAAVVVVCACFAVVVGLIIFLPAIMQWWKQME